MGYANKCRIADSVNRLFYKRIQRARRRLTIGARIVMFLYAVESIAAYSLHLAWLSNPTFSAWFIEWLSARALRMQVSRGV